MFTREELQKMAAGGYISDSEKERLALARQCLAMLDVVEAAREFNDKMYRWSYSRSAHACYSRMADAVDALDRLDKGNAPPSEPSKA